MLRRNSPTAASSASAANWASPRADYMRAARSAPNSSPPSNTLSMARGRLDHERRVRFGLPQAYAGMTIGLFGGSFDPAHAGHAHVAETALKRLGLDKVWWLVTPQNPLKPKSSSFETRFKSAKRMARGRKMVV